MNASPRLCVPLLLICVVACGNGTPQPGSSADSSEPAAQSAPGSAEPLLPLAAAPSSDSPPDSAMPQSSAAPEASAGPTANAAPAELRVTVKNIGLHIGGGPNDALTKAPIKRSVEPHFDAVAACFGQAESQDKGGDISLDLKIDKAGGKAELRKYRSAIKGADFEACVRKVFEQIEFEKPKTGTTMASYSLRLTPKK